MEKELEGTPPLSFTTIGEPLIDWSIKGKSGGVGDRTANLLSTSFTNGYYLSSSTGLPTTYTGFCATLTPTDVANADDVTFSYTTNREVKWMYSLFNGDSLVRRVSGKENGDSIDVSDGDSIYLCFYVSSSTVTTSEVTELMLNEGDTTSIYEPYGYKIDVTCGGETINIYLPSQLGASDSISMTDTGVSIPTVGGSNTLLVGTTVQPSSIYIKYTEGGDEMVTLAKIGGRYNTPLLEIRGLSTDTKPTTKIEGMIVTNGSTYIEIDTGDTYMFDAENGVWHNITG